MAFCGQLNATLLCLSLMVYDIVSPKKVLDYFQLLTCIAVALITSLTIVLAGNLIGNSSAIIHVFEDLLRQPAYKPRKNLPTNFSTCPIKFKAASFRYV